jgi:hypothetical protein
MVKLKKLFSAAFSVFNMTFFSSAPHLDFALVIKNYFFPYYDEAPQFEWATNQDKT